MIIKNSVLQLKDFDQKAGIVTFYFSNFGNRDSDGDVLEPGAFKKTIEENFKRIKHLKNHDTTQVPGVIREIQEDSKGAFAISQLAKTTVGRDTLIEYEAGIISEHSMGFNIIKDEFDNFEGVNRIKEVRLWEVSSLTAWGANPDTPTVEVKNSKQAIDMIEKLNKVLTNSNITDEGGERLQKALNELEKSLQSLKPNDSLKPKKDDAVDSLEILNSFKSKLIL